MKVRRNLYLDSDWRDALDGLVIRRGGNKSRIVNEALRDWLARRASKQVDDLLKVRRDRIPREVAAGRRDLEVVLEALVLFGRYQLTVTAQTTEPADAALATGHQRYVRVFAPLLRKISGAQRTPAP